MEEVKHLPCEIVSDILSSICKSWFSLIEDPSFAKLQLKSRRIDPITLFFGLIRYSCWTVIKDEKMWKTRDIYLEYTFKYEKQDHYLDFIIAGSCNGLLCMISTFFLLGIVPHCHFYGTFIYNPITRECLMLPVGGGRFFGCSVGGQIGFGVDSSDMYKVIQIVKKQSFSSHVDDCGLMGEIITLGESSWREIEIPYQSDYSQEWVFRALERMIFMNGVLYSIIRKPTTDEVSDQPIILVFDLDDEKFLTIEFPPFIELPLYYELGLTEIKGSLALHHRLDYHHEPSILRMWLIEINKSKGNQLYHCDHIRVREIRHNVYYCFHLVGLLSNNFLLYTVVIDCKTHLLVHCLEKKQFMHVQLPEAILRRFEVKSFVPSLVSPIAIACGKTKKDEVVGYSSLWELMSSCRVHPTFSFYREICRRCSPHPN
ncbi:hypothetical protein NE237_026516 [Protea cynaroides]|uniref:F-box associated beta-propeller type 3 domain-containing protein n=1 Tax=Protea cynaroides TaxID=273540 RepID=A0A9Q0K2D2_9MAGN|nr:hypothetical protein NE237_026516 [Protea cynaroides]